MHLETQQRRSPFLQRNWVRGITAWQESAMGAAMSSFQHDGTTDDDAPRPLKRRRLSVSKHGEADIDHLVASSTGSEARSILRIEVLKILHKDCKNVKAYQGPPISQDLTTRANCRITVLDTSSQRQRVLHCQSQLCEVTTFKDPAGPHRTTRVHLPRPFFVPRENILIKRRDDGTFDLSDSYSLLVELEAADGTTWPPLDAWDLGVIPQSVTKSSDIPETNPTDEWGLEADFGQLFGRSQMPLRLTLPKDQGLATHNTPYVMDVDLRWTGGFKALKRQEEGSMPLITAIDPDIETLTNGELRSALEKQDLVGVNGIHAVNGINGHRPASSHQEIEAAEDELEPENTPSRSLRTRGKATTYNLKVLSDQALGRDRKRRAKGGYASTINEGQVRYCLPTDQPICLDYYRCVSCGAYHQSLGQLQLHFDTSHSDYNFELENTPQGPQFRVTFGLEPISPRPKTYQLGRAAKPFNLETYLSGDASWITSRLGPENEENPFKSPISKRDSRVHSLSTSHSPAPKTRLSHRQEYNKPKGKIYVPDISQRLFHPVSKAILKPGDEVPKLEPDNSWLLHKHREAIGEFSDVDSTEKEFIREWDAYILQRNITSAAFFPRAWLEFVRRKATWLAAAAHRGQELGKHAAVMIARDVLTEDALTRGFALIDEARKAVKAQPRFEVEDADDQGADLLATELPPCRKGPLSCTICQQPVRGPSQLVCSNKQCGQRLYHKDCARQGAKTPLNTFRWYCNACTDQAKAVAEDAS